MGDGWWLARGRACDAGREPGYRPPGAQAQPAGRCGDAARRGRDLGTGRRPFERAFGGGGGAQRGHLGVGRASGREQPHREVRARRDVSAGCRWRCRLREQGGRPLQRPARHQDGFPGSGLRGRPRQQPDSGVRPGGQPAVYLDALWEAERPLHRPQRHSLCWRRAVRDGPHGPARRLAEQLGVGEGDPDRRPQDRTGVGDALHSAA